MTERVGTIAGLWRYPVKSMRGERLEFAAITRRGILGDRGWAVYDETRKGITGAKRLPALRGLGARYASEPTPGEGLPAVEIKLPDGSLLCTDAPDAGRRLGELVGRPVSFRALGPMGSETDPRLTSADETKEVEREVMGLLPGEPVADMSELSGEHLRLLRQGNYFDAFPLHLLTRTTLRTLASLAPESVWDERRFRPNLLVAADESDGYPEMAWLGRRLRAGTAVIEIAMACPRCVMATQAVEEIPHDPRIMRTLVGETSHNAGVYVSIVEEGEVRVGDAVELIRA